MAGDGYGSTWSAAAMREFLQNLANEYKSLFITPRRAVLPRSFGCAMEMCHWLQFACVCVVSTAGVQPVDKRKERGKLPDKKAGREETRKNVSRAATTRQCGHRALKLDALYQRAARHVCICTCATDCAFLLPPAKCT